MTEYYLTTTAYGKIKGICRQVVLHYINLGRLDTIGLIGGQYLISKDAEIKPSLRPAGRPKSKGIERKADLDSL